MKSLVAMHTGGRLSSILTYISSYNGRWACCTPYDNGTIDCDNPTNDQYPGPAPSQLATVAFISADGTASYATATATATGTNTSSSSPSSSSSSGIGAGAAAGIGVGVGFGVFIIAAIAALLYLRNRNPSHTKLQESNVADDPQPGWYLDNQQQLQQAAPQPVIYELDRAEPGPKELDSRQRPS